MVTLAVYHSVYEEETLRRISEFFGFHRSLVRAAPGESARDDDSREVLSEWSAVPNSFFVILDGDVSVGFIRIGYRGPIAAWIEDIFVDVELRGKGFATEAIGAAEDIVRNTPGYTCVCLDVAPRNSDALRLYHRLGYVDLSLITVRKEFGQSARDRPVRFLGHDFRV